MKKKHWVTKRRKKTFYAKIWILLLAKKGNLRIYPPFAGSWLLFRPLWIHVCILLLRYFFYTFKVESFAGKKLGELRNEFLQMWASGLRHCNQNQKVPGSNPTRRSVRLRDPTSLRGSWWPLGQNWKCRD